MYEYQRYFLILQPMTVKKRHQYVRMAPPVLLSWELTPKSPTLVCVHQGSQGNTVKQVSISYSTTS